MESFEKIKEISKQVYSQAEKLHIPLSKKCYSIWYEYFNARRQDLIAAVDEMIESKKPFTHDAIMGIYHRYMEDDKSEIMARVQSETQRIIKDMLAEMLSVNNASDSYQQKLSFYSDGLSQAEDIGQVQGIVGSILSDTKKMAESNQQLQKQFEKAKAQSEELNQKLEKVETDAYTDPLTGLYNRRTYDKEIAFLLEKYGQTKETFSLIMLDIDHFKNFNDTYGHQVGDEVLKLVGYIAKNGLKGMDIPTRYGGEEFVIILPETILKNACVVAEQLRIRLAVHPLRNPETLEEIAKITASLGVAEVRPGDDAGSVLERADKALYLAKESGRNNIKSENDL